MNHIFKSIVLSLLLLSILPATGCVTGRPAGPQTIAERESYLDDTVDALKQKWSKNRTINIVCHGHSVPAGYFKTPVVDTMNSYPHLFHAGLKERFPYAVVNVIVTAIGGETSERGAKRFKEDVLSHRPDVITIDYGLNDRGIGVERARAALSYMIKKTRARQIKVILLTPTGDTGANMEDPADPLNQQAELIRTLAEEYQVGLVDSLAEFRDYVKGGGKLEDLMSQGNHPNRKGHELVANRLLEFFED